MDDGVGAFKDAVAGLAIAGDRRPRRGQENPGADPVGRPDGDARFKQGPGYESFPGVRMRPSPLRSCLFLGKEAAAVLRGDDALDADGHGGHAVGEFCVAGALDHGGEGLLQDADRACR